MQVNAITPLIAQRHNSCTSFAESIAVGIQIKAVTKVSQCNSQWSEPP